VFWDFLNNEKKGCVLQLLPSPNLPTSGSEKRVVIYRRDLGHEKSDFVKIRGVFLNFCKRDILC
jgi:hypothetical protein